MEPETYITLTAADFSDICRICLAKEELIPFHQENLMRLLKTITSINFEEDEEGLPRNVCKSCISTLEKITGFIELSNSNDTTLKELLKKKDIFTYNEDVSDSDSVHYCMDEINPETDLNSEPEAAKPDSETTELTIEKDMKKRYCSFCKTMFQSINDLRKHQNEDSCIKCHGCNQCFKTLVQLRIHRKNNEACQIESVHKCEICGRTFSTNSRLKNHLRAHTNDEPYECKTCGKKFKFAQNRRRHENIVHRGIKPFKCDICGKAFAQTILLTNHKNVHDIRPHRCETCDQTFPGYRSYFIHLQTHEELVNDEVLGAGRDAPKPASCKKFLCTICGKTFSRKAYFDIHTRVHTGEQPYSCEICGKRFSQQSSRNMHLAIHTGERCYRCSLCNKSFKQSQHLKSHVKVHTKEKLYYCVYCGKAFGFNSTLTIHMRIHTGEKPYSCTVCGSRFYDSSGLSKHKKIHFVKLEDMQCEPKELMEDLIKEIDFKKMHAY